MIDEWQWKALADVLPHPGLVDDERFTDARHRQANDAVLCALLESVLKTRTVGEWFQLFDEVGVPCEIANPSFGREIFLDPIMRELGLIVEHQHPKLGRFEQFGTTIDFSVTPAVVQGPPPIVGQHTREILQQHGFSAGQIEDLFASGVVFEDLWVD